MASIGSSTWCRMDTWLLRNEFKGVGNMQNWQASALASEAAGFTSESANRYSLERYTYFIVVQHSIGLLNEASSFEAEAWFYKVLLPTPVLIDLPDITGLNLLLVLQT
jgi:hypothetical protein